MKRADLKLGDRVWVVLPYEGGRGWAEVIGLHAGRNIVVHFDRGQSAHNVETEFGVRGRIVNPRHVIKKENS